MTKRPHPLPSDLIALCASVDLPDQAEAPDWIHLVPTLQGEIATFDGRGPYRLADASAVIAASLANERGIPVDEMHATDLAGPSGGPAPARGWIKDMQTRDDGIWGRVEWTNAGRQLVADKAYRAISPVLSLHADRKTVRMIPRASLVNAQNLRGLTALNQEMPMTFMAKLAEKLGLGATASEDDMLAAIPAPTATTALQSALSEIGTVLGIEASNTAAIVAAVQGKAAEGASILALQAENSGLKTRLDTLETAHKRAASEAFVDAGLAEKRSGLSAANRETWITLHMAQPETATSLVNAMPKLGPSHLGGTPPGAEGEVLSLNAEQAGADLAARARAYQSKRKSEGVEIDYIAAVRAVSEGKK
jgi:phage I-like protein